MVPCWAHVPIDVFSARSIYPLVNLRLDQPLHFFRILGLYGTITGNYASHHDKGLHYGRNPHRT